VSLSGIGIAGCGRMGGPMLAALRDAGSMRAASTCGRRPISARWPRR
jgi:3-hydroxyisobutyrate dehydrogenase-like beta-hydroxyacid dehydrogenase